MGHCVKIQQKSFCRQQNCNTRPGKASDQKILACSSSPFPEMRTSLHTHSVSTSELAARPSALNTQAGVKLFSPDLESDSSHEHSPATGAQHNMPCHGQSQPFIPAARLPAGLPGTTGEASCVGMDG